MIKDAIGFSLNTLPIRVDASLPYDDVLRGVNNQLSEIYNAPYETLQKINECLSIKQDMTLFNVLISIDTFSETFKKRYQRSDIKVNDISIKGYTQYPFVITLTKNFNRLKVQVDFRKDIYSSTQANRFIDDLVSVLHKRDIKHG